VNAGQVPHTSGWNSVGTTVALLVMLCMLAGTSVADPDPHHFGKLDPHPHESEKQDPDKKKAGSRYASK
jgi:hypothetical protein